METRTAATTAATTPQQPLSRPGSAAPEGRANTQSASSTRGNYTSPALGAGRGIYRNGPSRARQHPNTPPIITSPMIPAGAGGSRFRTRPSTAPNPEVSPTTPRGARWAGIDPETQPSSPTPGPVRVTISMDDAEAGLSSPVPQHYRGRGGMRSIPSSPIGYREDRDVRSKARTLSADREGSRDRERRHSQVSAHSAASSTHKKPSLNDFVLGEELGRGSYSTVTQNFPNSCFASIDDVLSGVRCHRCAEYEFTHHLTSTTRIRHQDHQSGSPNR